MRRTIKNVSEVTRKIVTSALSNFQAAYEPTMERTRENRSAAATRVGRVASVASIRPQFLANGPGGTLRRLRWCADNTISASAPQAHVGAEGLLLLRQETAGRDARARRVGARRAVPLRSECDVRTTVEGPWAL